MKKLGKLKNKKTFNRKKRYMMKPGEKEGTICMEIKKIHIIKHNIEKKIKEMEIKTEKKP
jgi:hypothetical protein